MYLLLKRLELQGFKSFADKTILEFVEGSTAVVGPNGSGKSNISDAIRWVIGEMSAKISSEVLICKMSFLQVQKRESLSILRK